MRRLCSFHTESHGITRRAGFLNTEIRFFSRGESRSHAESLEAPGALEAPEAPEDPEDPEDPETPETPDVPDNLDSPEPPSEGKVTNCKFGA